MKTHLKLTITFKVTTLHWWLRYIPRHKEQYVSATFEGEMEVGDLRIGEQLSLLIFNDVPTKFRVRDITKTPDPNGGEVKSSMELYVSSVSGEMTAKGIRNHSAEEARDRLQTLIAAQLHEYGLKLTEAVEFSKKPKIEYIWSSLCVPDYMVPYNA